MKLTLEQFETKWAESNLSTTDWFDTTYGLFKELEDLQSRNCDGCKNLEDIGEVYRYCKELSIDISRSTEITFCCNRYEAKEQL